jgi:hypothetical protein
MRLSRIAGAGGRWLAGAWLGSLACCPQAAAELLKIHGTTYRALCNPVTGDVHTNSAQRSAFTLVMAGNQWRISVTNLALPGHWETRQSDGTNTFVIVPAGGGSATKDVEPARISQEATVTPGRIHTTLNADPLGVSLAYLAFIASAAELVDDTDPMPAPWTTTRDNMGNRGYRWEVQDEAGSPRVRRFELVRDRSLDRGFDEELLQLGTDYPDTSKEYARLLAAYDERGLIETGHVRARFVTLSETNSAGRLLPTTARLETFYPPPNGIRRGSVFELEVAGIESADATPAVRIASPPPAGTRVFDYRFKKQAGRKVFKYAEYVTRAGEDWPAAGDVRLAAQRDRWLRSGRDVSDFVDVRKRRLRIGWIAGAAALAGAGYALWRKRGGGGVTLEKDSRGGGS